MTDFPITFFHNPNCGTSRNTVGIEAAGYAPQVVEYLKVGWTEGLQLDLLAAMPASFIEEDSEVVRCAP